MDASSLSGTYHVLIFEETDTGIVLRSGTLAADGAGVGVLIPARVNDEGDVGPWSSNPITVTYVVDDNGALDLDLGSVGTFLGSVEAGGDFASGTRRFPAHPAMVLLLRP